jgi:large subunit ribosomal protein L10
VTRDEKKKIIEILRQTFQQNETVLLLTFSEVTVPDLTVLRRQIREAGDGYRVVKNTLAIRAAEETPVGQLNDDFKGPTAVAYSDSDPAALAKILKEFAKDHPGMEFKSGVVAGKAVPADGVADLADLPPRDELLAKLAYMFNAPLTRFASTLQSPLRSVGVLLKQVSEQKEEA